MKHLRFTLAPLALAVTTCSLAAETASRSTPEIVITASRSLQSLNGRLDAASVITRDDIVRQQAGTLADLLSQTTGMSLPATGGPLSSTGVFLRGFKSNQVLVLIDGVRANDANSGQFDFSSLRADDIERVEVLRGGYSSQYGSDAMGGVIQVFTRRSGGNSLSLRTGSFGTLESTLSLQQATPKGRAGVSLSQLDTRGFDATNSDKTGPFANALDKDGGRLRTLRLHGDHALGERGTLSASLLLKEQRTEFDNGVSDGNNSIAALAYDLRVNDRYQQRVTWDHNRTLLSTPAFMQKFDTLRNTLTWLHTLDAQRLGTVTGGLSYSDENLRGEYTDFSQPSFPQARIDRSLQHHAAFVILENRLNDFSYRLSGRHERHEQWGVKNTGSVRLGYALSRQIDVFTGVSSNFRAPTTNELFGNNGLANPNLIPEQSRQYDVGLSWRYASQHKAALTLYQSDVSNLIAGFPPVNVNKALLRGAELELAGNLETWGYTVGLLRARNVDKATGEDLVRRPGTQLTADIYLNLTPTVRTGIQQLARNSTNDVGGRNDGFVVVNAYATWRAMPKLDLGLRLDNLTDRDYELAKGFNTPGRSGYVTATYRF